MGELKQLRIDAGVSGTRFLAVGDVAEVSDPLVRILADRGLSGEICSSGDRALAMLKQGYFAGVLCEQNMPGMAGIELLGRVRASYPQTAFVMIAEFGDVRQGVLAMIAGASGYLLKPLHAEAVDATLRRALKRKQLERSLEKYRNGQDGRPGSRHMLLSDRISTPRAWNRDEAVEILGQLLRLRDPQASLHCQLISKPIK